MPSDVKITLSSVLSSTALRLSALVAAAMSAGYLWRAAVEPGGTAPSLAVVPTGLRAEPPDLSFNTLDLLRPAEPAQEPARGDQADAVAQPEAGARSSVQLVSVTVSAPQTGSAAPAPVRRSTKPVRTKPPKNGRKPRPKPPAPPRPNPPPPPAPQPPPPPPPPPVGPPPPPPPPPPVAGVETRPGRGRGDRNHHHTGPPGQQKPKKGKGNGKSDPGNAGSPGQNTSPVEQGNGGHGNGRGGKKGKG